MFSANYPLFEHGRVLKIEMLEALRDFPQDLLAIYLKDYANGILKGCNITTRDHFLVIEPGAILMQGVLYVLNESYELPYLANNRLTVLKVNCLGCNKEQDFVRYISQIYLDYQTECKETEIELCRFKLKQGANLRSKYKDFYDYNTEYDTINRIYTPYVSRNNITLAPEIIECFAKEVLSYSTVETIDLQFCLMILQHHGEIERGVLEAYLKIKGEWSEKGDTTEKLYVGLQHILSEIKLGGKRQIQTHGFGESIWVD